MFSDVGKEDRVTNLLLKGHESNQIPLVTDEHMAQEAIDLFKWCALHEPGFLIGQLILYPNSPLTPLALAILMCQGTNEFLTDKYNKIVISDVLLAQNPDNLLEVAKFVKSKAFGSGLGSRSQKTLRAAMENWTPSILQDFCLTYPKSVYSLTRLIHPRFKGERGEIIKQLLNKPPK